MHDCLTYARGERERAGERETEGPDGLLRVIQQDPKLGRKKSALPVKALYRLNLARRLNDICNGVAVDTVIYYCIHMCSCFYSSLCSNSLVDRVLFVIYRSDSCSQERCLPAG